MSNPFSWTVEDERHVAEFMQRVAALPTASFSVNPNYVWWKAQLLRRWDAERKAQIPLDVMQPIEIAAGLLVAGFLFYWSIGRVF